MSSRPPGRNALLELRGIRPRSNELLAVADATRVSRRRPAAEPELEPPPMHTIRAGADDWFTRLRRRAALWSMQHRMPSIADYPPLRLLSFVMGESPLSAIGGPSTAISGFAARSPRLLRYFADPGFESFVTRHASDIPMAANRAGQVRDFAPEEVIDDLWQRYQRFRASNDARIRASVAAERAAREAGRAPYEAALPMPRQ